MPSGQVYFRTGGDNGTWKDAFGTYGISFDDGSISRLITPAPNKDVVENRSRLQHGKRVIRKASYTRKDERTVSLEMHVTAPDKATFWQLYQAFCDEILDNGFFDIRHADIPGLVFRLTYVSCEQFSEFSRQLAKFTLTLNEPDPTNRGVSDKWIDEV